MKPLGVGTPKLKLIVRVKQKKGGTLVRILAPVQIIQVLVVIPSHLPKFPRSRAPEIQKQEVLKRKVVAITNQYAVYL